MKEILKDRIEFVLGIITLTVISLNRELFGDLQIAIVGLEVVVFLIIYDIVKFLLFSSPIIGPKWLLLTNPIFGFSDKWKARKLSDFPFTTIKKTEAAVDQNARLFILTPNLSLDTQNNETIKSVRDNISRGVRYVFLTTDQPDMVRTIENLLEIHNHSKNITVYMARKDFIDGIAADNIMIINEPSVEPRGYLQIPEGSGNFWAQMSLIATEKYYSNIKEIIQRADPRNHDEHSICRLVSGPAVVFLHAGKP